MLLDGAPFAAWEYDEGRAELTLHGANGGSYTVLFAVAAAPEEAGTDAPAAGPRLPGQGGPDGGPPGHGETTGPGMQAWCGGDGIVRYRLDTAGPLGWRLYDAAGRIRVARPAAWTIAGDGVIPIGGAVAGGIYFLRLERPGRLPVQMKIPVVR